jgi:hypothetical protein
MDYLPPDYYESAVVRIGRDCEASGIRCVVVLTRMREALFTINENHRARIPPVDLTRWVTGKKRGQYLRVPRRGRESRVAVFSELPLNRAVARPRLFPGQAPSQEFNKVAIRSLLLPTPKKRVIMGKSQRTFGFWIFRVFPSGFR